MSRAEAETGILPFDVSLPGTKTYERGAFLLAALAVPEPILRARSVAPAIAVPGKAVATHSLTAEDKRAERQLSVFVSMCAWALRLLHNDPDNWDPISVRPQYAFRDISLIEKDIKFTERQLGQRMVAGRMAARFLLRSAGGQVDLPKGVQRLSVNELAKYVQEDAGQADPENVEKRIWRPSRSVIHFCVAAAVIGQRRWKEGLVSGVESFLVYRDHLEMVLDLAEQYALLIEKDPTFPVKAENLIRFPTGRVGSFFSSVPDLDS